MKKYALIALFSLLLFLFMGCSNENKQTNKASSPSNDAHQGTLVKIQGKWQSVEDGSAAIEIKDDKFISYYDNGIMSTETIEFINNADERKPDPNGEYFIVKGEFDAMIYYLVSVSETELEYTFEGRGNTLKYKKIQ